MIAYDIDGIFVGDMIFDDLGPNAKKTMLAIRHTKIKPIFEPLGDYFMVTGRPIDDKASTVNWVMTSFENPPLRVYHDNPNPPGWQGSAEYKLKVLENVPEITMFVESGEDQVKFIKENLKRKDVYVMLFKDFVRLSLELVRSEYMDKGIKNEVKLIVPDTKIALH
jgi:hypothetical protein